ncbi:MAG: hypothetical protein EOO16_15090 [Chitinophagaceae bacterium]|nr:MAG: hypothetical protein EOO16_15090 [Chitinophagaceae bacterium]
MTNEHFRDYLSPKTRDKLFAFGVYQILGGLWCLISVAGNLFQFGFYLALMPDLFFALVSILCGLACCMRNEHCLRFSFYNQCLQLPSLMLSGWIFQNAQGVYFNAGIGLNDGIVIQFDLGTSKVIAGRYDFTSNHIHINLIAGGIMVWINGLLRKLETARQNRLLMAIGEDEQVGQ